VSITIAQCDLTVRILSYNTYPPLQAPETYNLSQVIQEVKKMHSNNPSD
jgi:hypothetical protein